MSQEKTLTLSPGREKLIVCIAMSTFPLMGMGVDLIAPSLPAISHALQVSSTISKSLIAVFLLGYGIGCFCLGFLSDAWGRRKLAIAGFILFILASLLPALVPTVPALLVGRLLQGVSLGAATLMRTILSDILPPERLVRVATYISTMWGIGPIIGPVIGGYLQYYIGWQACFYFFALYGLIIATAVIIAVPETHLKRQVLNIVQIKNNLGTIVRHSLFMGVVTTMGVTYSSLIIFNTLGPFLIQVKLGFSPVYFGHIALWMGVMFLFGTITCRQLIKTYTPENILAITVPISLTIGSIWVMLSYFWGESIPVIVVPSLLLFFVCGVVFPAAMGKGLALFRHLAGSSSAVMNLVNLLITSLAAFVMSLISVNSALSLALIYMGLMVLSGLAYKFMIHNNKKS